MRRPDPPRALLVLALLPFAAGCGGESSDTTSSTTTTTTEGSGGSTSTPSTTASEGGGGTGGSASTSTSTGGGGASTASIVSVSNKSLLESEAHIAVAPGGAIAITFIAASQTGSFIGVVFSTDGGQTWSPVAEVAPPTGSRSGDPVLAVGPDGSFYLAFISFNLDATFNPKDMQVYVARAEPGAPAFGAPVPLIVPADPLELYDKPWIAVTQTGALLVTYAREDGTIFAARSADQGQSWTSSVVVPGGTFHNLAYPCTSPAGGRDYVVYFDDFGIALRASDDDGQSWTAIDPVSVSGAGEPVAFQDPTCVADGQNVWVSYGLSEEPFGRGASLPLLDAVRVARSADGGQSILSRTVALDPAAGQLFFLPQLARATGQTLDMVYYAGQADMDPTGTFRHARSTDGGSTWQPSETVHGPILFTGDRTTPVWLGDYMGLSVLGGAPHAAFVDNTSGFAHVAHAAIEAP
jgi:hypothetical protein